MPGLAGMFLNFSRKSIMREIEHHGDCSTNEKCLSRRPFHGSMPTWQQPEMAPPTWSPMLIIGPKMADTGGGTFKVLGF